jgi:uncharacterized protein YukE
MPTFQVTAAELMIASGLVGSSSDEVVAAHAVAVASIGALAETPAAGAYDEFVSSMNSALTTLSHASGVLGAALGQAAEAYQIADRSAAASLSMKRT